MAANAITIKLSNQAPVTIDDEEWPILTRVQKVFIRDVGLTPHTGDRTLTLTVRTPQSRHISNQFIVYADYCVITVDGGQSPGDYNLHAGVCRFSVEASPECDQLPQTATQAALAYYTTVTAYIREVAWTMSRKVHIGNDATAWDRMADMCICQLPAVDLRIVPDAGRVETPPATE